MNQFPNIPPNLKYKKETIIKPTVTSNISLQKELVLFSYPDSGVYIFKSERVHLTISAGPNGQKGLGGHAHNDKLSFELNLDGKDIVLDPGTYIYTPLPEKRNNHRKTSNHNTLVIEGQEQNRWQSGIKGLFSLLNESKCEIIKTIENKNIVNGIAIKLSYRNIQQIRIFQILDKIILINDYSNLQFLMKLNPYSYYSNGYGKLIYNTL